MNPFEAKLVPYCVEFFEKQIEAPLDVLWAVRCPAPKLVVEDDLALLGEPLERSEVVMRRAGTAMKAQQRRAAGLAGDPPPRTPRTPGKKPFEHLRSVGEVTARGAVAMNDRPAGGAAPAPQPRRKHVPRSVLRGAAPGRTAGAP